MPIPSSIFLFSKVMLSKSPNPAHFAIAECAERLKAEGRRVRVITQVKKAEDQPTNLKHKCESQMCRTSMNCTQQLGQKIFWNFMGVCSGCAVLIVTR